MLADKPWIIEPAEMPALEATLRKARERRIAIYDAMTQRFEVSCLIQKELVNDPAVFGEVVPGSEGEPAVFMESVHYVKKEVAGQPLLRPAGFFDPRQQGEPLADVGTHLVDLVQWTLSPEKALDHSTAIHVQHGERRWLSLGQEQFRSVTGPAEYPTFLRDFGRGGQLDTVGRNLVSYTLRGVHVKLDVIWDYEAPTGGRDTELAVYRGTHARVEVRQGQAENYVPEVYVAPVADAGAAERQVALETWRARRAAALGFEWIQTQSLAEPPAVRLHPQPRAAGTRLRSHST